MHRLLRPAVLAVSLAVAPMALAAEVTVPSEAALKFVGGFSNDHLSGMLSRIGGRQPVMVALSQVHGDVLGTVFDAEIDRAVAKYGAAWQQNMAIAWTPLLSTEEFESLAIGGARSPHTEKYLGLRGAAGQTMQKLSQELFRDILKEVIQNTISALTEPGESAGGSAAKE